MVAAIFTLALRVSHSVKLKIVQDFMILFQNAKIQAIVCKTFMKNEVWPKYFFEILAQVRTSQILNLASCQPSFDSYAVLG